MLEFISLRLYKTNSTFFDTVTSYITEDIAIKTLEQRRFALLLYTDSFLFWSY